METLTRKRRNNKIRGSDVEERVAEWLLKEVPHEEIVARLDRDYGFRVCRKTLHEYVKHFFKNAQNESIKEVQEKAKTGVETDRLAWAVKYGDYSQYLEKQYQDIDFCQDQIKRLKAIVKADDELYLQADGSGDTPILNLRPKMNDRTRRWVRAEIRKWMKMAQQRRKTISDIVDGPNGIVMNRTEVKQKVIGAFYHVVVPNLGVDARKRVTEQFRLALNKI